MERKILKTYYLVINGYKRKVHDVLCQCGLIKKSIRTDHVNIYKCECQIRKFNIGDRYGNITIYSDVTKIVKDSRNKNKYYIQAKCDCGRIFFVRKDHLVTSNSKTCGKCPTFLTEHRYLVNRSSNILQRCNNSTDKKYQNYGGFGIKCCLGNTIEDVARSLFLVPGYVDGYEIDRVDVTGDYTIIHPIHGSDVWYSDDFPNYPCLGNLRWLPKYLNALNKHKTHVIRKFCDCEFLPHKDDYIPYIINKYKENHNIISKDSLIEFLLENNLAHILSKSYKNKLIKELLGSTTIPEMGVNPQARKKR